MAPKGATSSRSPVNTARGLCRMRNWRIHVQEDAPHLGVVRRLVHEVPQHVGILEGAVSQLEGVGAAGQGARDGYHGGVTDSLDLRPEALTQSLEHRVLGGLGRHGVGAGQAMVNDNYFSPQ